MAIKTRDVTAPPKTLDALRTWTADYLRAIRRDLLATSNVLPVSGDGTKEGDWQFYDDGTDLLVQRMESETWQTKGKFLASSP